MKQDFRTGSLDTLTAGELSGVLHYHKETWFQKAERVRLSGLRVTRIPRITLTATATSFTLSQASGESPCGPESGFIWLLRRFNVASNGALDQAVYSIYHGSDITPSPTNLIDSGPLQPIYGVYQNTQAVGPAAPVSATSYVNQNPFTVIVTLTNTGGVSSVNINGATTSFFSGATSFALQPGGFYQVTWTVTQPTATTTVPANAQPQFITGFNKGFLISNAYQPGNKAVWIWPDEQLFATVAGATIGNQYTITGVALEVPAELQGKLVG